jgi:hypothetical protein
MNGELNFSLLEEQTFLYLITACRPSLGSHSLLFIVGIWGIVPSKSSWEAMLIIHLLPISKVK